MMATFHRRRQWRDKRRPATLEELDRVNLYIGAHMVITGFFTAFLLLVVIFGDRFINLFLGG